ncbi:MAG: Gfo/Idh/MocA family oxidoreductase [Candidatus Hydrogenedentes bacterium]|nr:Gfo/Idh/MocA family oxidoreductase [Candidatus Hydrogenedentota bacterium]
MNLRPQVSNRRDFMKQAAVGPLVSGLAFPAILSAAPNTQTLRIGLIGCGNRGTGAAIEALNADANTAVVAMGDVFEDRLTSSLETLRKHAPDRIKVDKGRCFLGFDAYQDVIAGDVDVVLLATPPAFRPLHLKAAIEAGKHAFAECIAAVDAPGIRSFLDSSLVAKEKGLGILSGFCWRYDNSARAVKEQIKAGAIGNVRAVYATYYRESFNKHYGGERRPEWTDLEWQIRDWADFLWLGGDLCIGLSGGHSADKMAWWMDDVMPIKAVGVGGRQFPGEGNTFDHCQITYEYSDGVRGFLGVRAQDGCHNENADYIIGSDGVCTIGRGSVPVITGANPWTFSGERDRMHQKEQDEFFASIRAGSPINDGQRMAHTSLMALMGRMAAYTGQEITWEQALNSQQKLVPDHLDWDTKIDLTPPPQPGVTEFS